MWSFGIFCGLWVYFSPSWYVVVTKKDLEILRQNRLLFMARTMQDCISVFPDTGGFGQMVIREGSFSLTCQGVL
jgi:hypothetical protein